MSSSRAPLVACLVALASAACGSDVETSDGSGGDGATGSSSEAQVGSTTGGGGAPSSGTGGAECQPWEECTCAPCNAEGGTCLVRCNFGAGYECFTPGPPAEDEFSCGGFVNCSNTEACVDVPHTGGGDNCVDHFCAVLPDPCAFDRTCACLARYIDNPSSLQGPGTCTDAGGEIHVTYPPGFAGRPPWDEPWCGAETCAGEETCWACSTDGETVDTYVCAATAPGPEGSPGCMRQWGEPVE